MRTPVTLRVEIDDAWDAGMCLQVYTDRGSGTIDTDAPLLAEPMEVFPNALPSAGFGAFPFGAGEFGSNRPGRPQNGGFGDQPFASVGFGTSSPYVLVTVNVPAAFGAWKFAVESLDAEGNAQGAALVELQRIVSGTEPVQLQSFGVSSYDSQNDVLTLTLSRNTE